MKVLVTGASGLIGSALCDALFARGDDVVGLSRDPARARGANPRVTWHAWEPTLERPPAAAFEGVDGVVHLLGEQINQRWTDEAKQKIMETRRTGTHNLVGAIAGLERKPSGAGQPVGGRLLRRPRRATWSTRATAPAARASTPRSSSPGSRPRTRSTPTDVRLVIVRTGQVLDRRGRPARGAADPVQARRRRPDRRRQPVPLLDPHRRRGRDPALGARQPRGQRRRQRQLAQPGDQQGVLQGARPRAGPAGGDAAPRLRPRPQIRLRVRQGAARRAAGDAEADAGAGVRVPAPGVGRGARRTCFSG